MVWRFADTVMARSMSLASPVTGRCPSRDNATASLSLTPPPVDVMQALFVLDEMCVGQRRRSP